jgi:hypothetical protein
VGEIKLNVRVKLIIEYLKDYIFSKNKDALKVFLMIFVVILPSYLLREPSLDEIWNFQFARRMLDGQVPYKDFYFILFPFASILNATFLRLFGQELYVFRIVGVFINSFTGLLLYKVSITLLKDRYRAFLIIFSFCLLGIMFPENNYNWTAVMFFITALMIEFFCFQEKKNSRWLNFFIGIFIGLSTISKQSIGMAAFIASVLFTLIHPWMKSNDSTDKKYKEILKNQFKVISSKTGGFLVIIIMLLIYLYHNKVLYAMLDQTILGVYTKFRERFDFSYLFLIIGFHPFVGLLAVVLPISLILLLTILIWERDDGFVKKIALLLFLYGAANFILIYPSADPNHLLFSYPVSLINIFVEGRYFHKRIIKNNSTSILNKNFTDKALPTQNSKPLFLLVMIMLPLLTLAPIIRMKWSSENYQKTEFRYLKGIYFSEKSIKHIDETIRKINEFEKNGSIVYVIDHRASIYMIPLNRFSLKSETFFEGEFGSNAEIELIEKISKENIIVMIANDQYYKNKENYNQHHPNKNTKNIKLHFHINSSMKLIETTDHFLIFTN